jgi:O-antigen ligase
VFNPARQELRRIRHPILLVATLILGLMILSVPTSLYQHLSFWFIFGDHLKTFVMMLMLGASIRVVKDVERFAIAQVCGAALYSILILTRFEIDESGRLAGLFYYDANDLGMLIVCVLPLVVYFMRARALVHLRLLALLTAGLFIVTIVRTGSRGALLGLIAVGIYLLVAYRAVPVRVRIGAVAACFAMLLIFSNEKYWALMSTILNPKADYNWTGNSEAGRLEIWRRGMGYMMRRPITGVGVAAFNVAEGTLSPLASRQAFGLGLKWSAAHNSFVQIAAELGVGGLLLFLALLYTSFRATAEIGRGPPGSSKRRRGDEAALAQALTGTLIGYCVSGFFLSQAYSAFMYSIYGLLVGFWYVTVGRWRVATPPGRAAAPRGRRLRR